MIYFVYLVCYFVMKMFLILLNMLNVCILNIFIKEFFICKKGMILIFINNCYLFKVMFNGIKWVKN